MSKARRIFPRLWQRVFMYAILLVLASHLVSFAVFRFSIENSMYTQVLDGLASSGAAALEGKDGGAAKVLAEFFRNHTRALWVERSNGELVAGEAQPGLSHAQRRSFPVRNPHDGVWHMETGDPGAPYLAATPVSLVDGDATLYLYLKKMPPPPMSVLFIQGLIAVCVIGGALSIWTAWRIARPLRRLRSEVLEIAGGNLCARVSVKGSEEICQVAEAVNSMARNLADNIIGMRELVANMSHEMRSPLARMNFSMVIIEEGMQALVRRHGKAPSPRPGQAPPVVTDSEGRPLALRHVSRMMEEIEHMESLVGSCLLNSKLDLRQEGLKVETLNLSLLCGGILSRYAALFRAKGLVFSRDIQEDVLIGGDEELLSVVLTNLLDNALKYTARGGRVRLALREERGEALLSLENSHAAIDEAELPRLFDPFFRGTDAAGGTAGAGLGLSLVRKIADRHQGGVTATNGNMGLLLVVRLPRGQAPPPEFVRWFFERHGEASVV